MTNSSAFNVWISFIILLIISSLTAYYAEKKGRSPLGWFILGILFSILAPLILYFLPSLKKESENNQIKPPSTPPASTLQSPILPEDKLWFYLDKDHNQYGPVSIIALKELWDHGQLEITSYVWTEGMEKWHRVEHLEGLKQALHKPSPL